MLKSKAFPAAIVIPALLFLAGCSEIPVGTKNTILMDTFVSVEIKDSLDKNLKNQILNKTISRMRSLTKGFNYFGDESELARINSLKPGEELLLSDEMFAVLKTSRDIFAKTGGAFDVAMGKGDWKLDEKKHAIVIEESGVKINLGGIAKGFIVDEGIKVLKDALVRNAIINAGGDMYCMGQGTDAKGWKIGIRDPVNTKKVIASFNVRDRGVATSGGYERFTKSENGKYSHIIDPKTGEPIKIITRSVTVVADDCATADALATALYVLGPKKGLALIEILKKTECVIIDTDGKFYVSSGLTDLISTE
ncbi:MAG: FAD:protein FMN transferase [Candidatus Omnitrophica bacterium]|nr:FAD:protein FMN transferase [Candidatus Omnitrophota bacterium]